jgi:hypothetical protein
MFEVWLEGVQKYVLLSKGIAYYKYFSFICKVDKS